MSCHVMSCHIISYQIISYIASNGLTENLCMNFKKHKRRKICIFELVFKLKIESAFNAVK